MEYVALLRGINVSGKNKVSMNILKEVLVDNGFLDVQTYINSGNVIFSLNNDVTPLEIKKEFESLIKKHFSIEILVVILSANNLIRAVEKSPKWWDFDKAFIHYIATAIPPVNTKDIVLLIGKSDLEQLDVCENIIFWSAPRKTYSKTNFAKLVGTPKFQNVTIRNANTTKKLVQLFNTNTEN